MSVEQELIRQGIAALESGDKTRARKLLTQAVKVNAQNETAWYYLAKAQISPEKRRECLERVLKIDPDHLEAKRELDAIPVAAPRVERETIEPDFEVLKGGESPSPKPRRAIPVVQSGGVRVPRGIPDAPDRISLNYVTDFVQAAAMDGVAVVTGKPTSDTDATWWKIIFTVAMVGFITGLANVAAYLINYLRFPFSFNLLQVLFSPFFVAFMALVAVGAGTFISHWYATHYQGGRATLLEHTHPLVNVWTPASIVLAALGLLERLLLTRVVTLEQMLFGAGTPTDGASWVLTIAAIGVTVMSVLLMVRALKQVYKPIPENALTIIALIMLVVTAFVF